MYVTAILPYVVLGIFLIRGLTLKGAVNGILFLFVPDVCFKVQITRQGEVYEHTRVHAFTTGGWVNQPNNLAGCRRSGLLFLWAGVGRPHLLLKLQFCSVRGAQTIYDDLFSPQDYKERALSDIFVSCSNNCVQDAVILSVVTAFTSVYAATVTYSIIGFRATEKFDSCISKWVKSWGFDFQLNLTHMSSINNKTISFLNWHSCLISCNCRVLSPATSWHC